MMIRFLGAAAIVLGAGLSACATEPAGAPGKDEAGDPVKTLPNSYKLEFENDYVRIVRVHYDAGAKLPEHLHPAGATGYVYLNDNDGVVFNHAEGNGNPLTRPPVKAGGARFATSLEEHHTVENTSSTPTDFIRIWFKTDTAGLPHNVRRRIPLSEAEFTNAVTRVTRPAAEAGEPLVVTPSQHASVVVAWPNGKPYWIDPSASPSIPPDSNTRGFVRFELLTAIKK